jgi:hypothetical protein
LGKLDYFLVIEVHHSTSCSLLLSQTKYIRDLLTKAKMENANGIASPMASSTKLSKYGSNHVPDPTFFRSIVGGLQYVTITDQKYPTQLIRFVNFCLQLLKNTGRQSREFLDAYKELYIMVYSSSLLPSMNLCL